MSRQPRAVHCCSAVWRSCDRNFNARTASCYADSSFAGDGNALQWALPLLCRHIGTYALQRSLLSVQPSITGGCLHT